MSISKNFKKIAPQDIVDNPFTLIGDDWMLITGTKENGEYNTMTASWGGVGILWKKPVAFIFVRPQRYTYEFTESSDKITLSFFTEEYRDALKLCGSKSGRDIDKAKEAGITPVKADNGSVYFEEARLVMVCRKLYADDIKECCFIDKAPLSNYLNNDFHKMYVAEIEEVLTK